MTIEELQKIEDDNKKKVEERKKWLKEKDYFIALDCKKVYGEGNGKVLFRVKETDFEQFEDFKYKGECEIVYKTNAWFEKLQELDI